MESKQVVCDNMKLLYKLSHILLLLCDGKTWHWKSSSALQEKKFNKFCYKPCILLALFIEMNV